MLTADRHRRILDYLQTRRSAKITELAEALSSSITTVRRGLNEIADLGLIRRVHGGALLIENTGEEPPALQRRVHNAEAKRRIGDAAAALVKDSSTIIITGGTTTEATLPDLAPKQGLTVITNAINIAYTLSRYPQITVVVLGGWLRHSELSLLGHLADQALRDLRADQLFHGSFALDPESGLAGSHTQEIRTDKSMIAAARELIILADHTKFGQLGAVILTPVSRVSTVITNALTAADCVQPLRDQGIRVIQV